MNEEDPERDRATQEKEKEGGGGANEDEEQATLSEHLRKDFVAFQKRLCCEHFR